LLRTHPHEQLTAADGARHVGVPHDVSAATRYAHVTAQRRATLVRPGATLGTAGGRLVAVGGPARRQNLAQLDQNSGACEAPAGISSDRRTGLLGNWSLMPHFGGKNNLIGSGVAEKRDLIRFRVLARSGAASRQYLSVSQNRPWTS